MTIFSRLRSEFFFAVLEKWIFENYHYEMTQAKIGSRVPSDNVGVKYLIQKINQKPN